MSDDRYIRSVKDLEEVGCKWWPKDVRDEAMKVSIHPISKWLLCTVLDNLYVGNGNQLMVDEDFFNYGTNDDTGK